MIECPNYDEIVNFLYSGNDEISKYLIDCYQEYIFNVKSLKSKINIDNIMKEYIEKKDFYKYVQNYFDVCKNADIFNSYDKVVRKLFKLYILLLKLILLQFLLFYSTRYPFANVSNVIIS